MNLKITKMSESKFYWDSDTIDYYANFQDGNGWASTAFEIYKYVADECDYEDEKDMRALYLNLLTKVEDKINK
jgi:hypothetical protein